MKKQNLILYSIILIFFLIKVSSSGSNELNSVSGKAIIIDGDTIKINGENIRFGGIDAPESYFFGKKQFCYLDDIEILCGILSKEKLEKKIGKNFVTCLLEKDKDRHKRHVGECYINNESLSVYMVKSGYAFDYPKYSNGKFKKDQEFAEYYSLGLWNMKFEYPWIWRKKNR
tara:strand:+ start:442 stop:957 length:516 start_codon:yes stop_codon:yes gene_type:complete